MSESPVSHNPESHRVTTKEVVKIPNVPLPAHEHKILGRSNGLSFLNLELELYSKDGIIYLNSTGRKNNFVEMSKDRGNPNNIQMSDFQIDNSISTGQKLPLANIGVSVAVVIEIAGEDYLILARRPNGMLLLPSGYVDSANKSSESKFIELALATALKELTEEIIIRDKDSHTGQLLAKTYQIEASTDNSIWSTIDDLISKEYSADSKKIRLNLTPAYQANNQDLYDLNYQTTNPIVLKPTNNISFLPSLDLNQKVDIDGQGLDHGFFYYLRESRSGQIVYPFRMEANSLSRVSIQHAETTPDRSGQPGDLLEVLDPEGIILAKISTIHGLLTGESFRLVDGNLIDSGINEEQLILSEVFNTKFIPVDQEKALLPVTVPKIEGDNVIKTACFKSYKDLAITSFFTYVPE